VSASFVASPADESVAAELSALAPENPFATTEYFESRRQAGWAVLVVTQRDPTGSVEHGCGAFLKTRGWFRKLEIPSLPAVSADDSFWDDLRELCRRLNVTKLELGTFASPLGVEIPDFGTCMHRTRCEFVLDLTDDLFALLDRNHRRNVKRAREAGLVVKRTLSIEAVSAHRAMIDRSMDRRRALGEDVPSVGPSREFLALLQSGAGELYQVFRGETVLSSGIVLRAPNGAYGHSTGTSPEGMAVGASHFLVHGIASQLSADGVQTYNLGGADEGSGLARFKTGFGASPRAPLPSASCYVGPLWRRTAYRAIEPVRSEQQILLRSLKERLARPKVSRQLASPKGLRWADPRIAGRIPESWAARDYDSPRLPQPRREDPRPDARLRNRALPTMSDRFVALPAQESVVAELSAVLPTNAFATVGYFESRRRTGSDAWVLVRRNASGHVESGCGAFILRRGVNRKLEIPSLPAVSADSCFWDDLWKFCRRHFVTKLELGTFGSPVGVQIPEFGTCLPHARSEYILDLSLDLEVQIDRRHRAHIKKARRAGLIVRRTRSVEAVGTHRAMIGCSMDRRRERGEDVPTVGPERDFAAFLQTGAGELYQALDGETVLSSGLVLSAPKGAYFHSRGTSPEGMAVGASHLVIYHIMTQLKTEGALTFNLGGADEGSGLERFKKRFGAVPVQLPSATCYVGPAWARRATWGMELVRSDGLLVLRSISRRLSRRDHLA